MGLGFARMRGVMGLAAALAVVFGVALMSGVASAQFQAPQNEAYVNDSTVAADTLASVGDLVRAGNASEAARSMQRLLDEEGDKLISVADAGLGVDEDRFISVGTATRLRLLRDERLLEAYIEQQRARAARDLEAGEHALVARQRLLTPAGFEAALRVAQERFERGLFFSAWRMLSVLEDHPSWDGGPGAMERRRDAALLAAQVVRYLAEDGEGVPSDIARRVSAWAESAGVAVDGLDAVEPPAAVAEFDRGYADSGDAVQLDGVIPAPLHVTLIDPGVSGGPAAAAELRERIRAATNRNADQRPQTLPLIVGDTAFVVGPTAVVAFDRFTLRPRWRHSITPGRPELQQQQMQTAMLRGLISPPSPPVVAGPAVVVVTSPLFAEAGAARESVIALDRETGAVLWETTAADLPEDFADAQLIGPAEVEGDVAVVALRRAERNRRLVVFALAGISIHDGRPLWTTPLSSLGVIPYQQGVRGQNSILIHRGLAIRADEIGVITGVDVATGEPVWLRSSGIRAINNRRNIPWSPSRPIADGETVLTIDPERNAVLRLVAETGEAVSVRNATTFGSPEYLMRVGERLAVVSDSAVVFLGLPSFEQGRATLAGGGRLEIRGRALVAGDRLLVPVRGAILSVDPEDPVEVSRLPLDAQGNIAVADGQALVSYGAVLSSHLAWDIAAAQLEEAIASEPDNPSAAITLSELAYRAERSERIVPSVDRAMAALGDRGVAPGAGSGLTRRDDAAVRQRARLFDTIRTMVDTAQRDQVQRSVGVDSDRPEGPRLDPVIVGELVTRMSRLASTNGERVTALFSEGLLYEARASVERALDAYQRVLIDPELSASGWTGSGFSVRADLEATRRVRALVERSGGALYAPFETEARARLDALPARADADELETIARGYPLAPAAVEAWNLAATVRLENGEPFAAERALRSALTTAEQIRSVGLEPPTELVSLAGGRLLSRLLETGREEDAMRRLEAMAGAMPGAMVRLPTEEVLAATLLERVRSSIRSRRLRARIGSVIPPQPEPQLLAGYVLEPVSLAGDRAFDRSPLGFGEALMVSPTEAALRCVSVEVGAVPGRSPLVERWARAIDRHPILLRRDASSAWLYWPANEGGWFERIDLGTGETMWRSDPWPLAGGGDGAGDGPIGARNWQDARAQRRNDPRFPSERLTLSLDRETIVISDTKGTIVALDAVEGRILWTDRLAETRVARMDVGGGIVAIGAVDPAERADTGVTLLDARTGERLQTVDLRGLSARWVRVSPDGLVFVGLDDRVLAIDATTRTEAWEVVAEELTGSESAWTLDNRLIVRSGDGMAYQMNARDGTGLGAPLDTRGRLASRSDVGLRDLSGGRAMISTQSGFTVFNQSGTLVGVDAISTAGELTVMAVGEGVGVVVESLPMAVGLSRPRRTLHLVDPASGRLLDSRPLRLFGEAQGVTLLDGYVLVTAGDAVLVVQVPAE